MNKCYYCKEVIKRVNNENAVMLNSAEYIACDNCYDAICSYHDFIPFYRNEIAEVIKIQSERLIKSKKGTLI
jgi:hypothetical protein